MPSSVGAQLNRKFTRASSELKGAQRSATTAGLLALKRGVEGRLPASRRLSGVGKKGGRVGVRFDLQSDTRGEVKATGPLHLLERDTKAHEIRPKAYVGTRGRGRRAQKGAALMAAFGLNAQNGGALKLPSGDFRGSVKHPGTKGKHVFEKGIADGRDKALKAMADHVSDAIKRGLRS